MSLQILSPNIIMHSGYVSQSSRTHPGFAGTERRGTVSATYKPGYSSLPYNAFFRSWAIPEMRDKGASNRRSGIKERDMAKGRTATSRPATRENINVKDVWWANRRGSYPPNSAPVSTPNGQRFSSADYVRPPSNQNNYSDHYLNSLLKAGAPAELRNKIKSRLQANSAKPKQRPLGTSRSYVTRFNVSRPGRANDLDNRIPSANGCKNGDKNQELSFREAFGWNTWTEGFDSPEAVISDKANQGSVGDSTNETGAKVANSTDPAPTQPADEPPKEIPVKMDASTQIMKPKSGSQSAKSQKKITTERHYKAPISNSRTYLSNFCLKPETLLGIGGRSLSQHKISLSQDLKTKQDIAKETFTNEGSIGTYEEETMRSKDGNNSKPKNTVDEAGNDITLGDDLDVTHNLIGHLEVDTRKLLEDKNSSGSSKPSDNLSVSVNDAQELEKAIEKSTGITPSVADRVNKNAEPASVILPVKSGHHSEDAEARIRLWRDRLALADLCMSPHFSVTVESNTSAKCSHGAYEALQNMEYPGRPASSSSTKSLYNLRNLNLNGGHIPDPEEEARRLRQERILGSGRPKRMVRFSIANEVHEYEPSQPIDT